MQEAGQVQKGNTTEEVPVSLWERRERGGLYYTRSRKVAGRAVREYVGNGPLAELEAKTDALKRLRREEEAKTWREEQESLESLDQAAEELNEAAEILTRAALLAAGYRQHNRGEWRRNVDQKRPKTEEQGLIVPAEKVSTPIKVEEVSRSSEELLNELRPLVAQAREGDEEASHRIRGILEETPKLAQTVLNTAAKKAERILLKRTSGNDILLREALSLQLEAMRKEIAGPDPTPLERLLAERVAACRLQLQQADVSYASRLGKLTIAQSEYHQRRLDRLHRRYLSAIRALVQVRKLLKPTVTQINVAEQQVNVAAEHLRVDS